MSALRWLYGTVNLLFHAVFTMYNYKSKETRSDVGCNTGLRSELGRQIKREHPETLLPSLPTAHFIPDGNHSCLCSLNRQKHGILHAQARRS